MKVIGLNCGLGVPLFPFKDNIIANIEQRRIFHTPGDKNWKVNFENVPLYRSIYDFKPRNVDVLISSPDCGAGSVLRLSRNKEFGDNKRNPSLMSFFSGVKLYNPKFILFENLPTLFNSFSKERFQEELSNYHLVEYTETMDKWGNSQINRERLVIVGIRKDLNYLKIAKCFKLETDLPDLKTCEELYGDLEEENVSFGHVRECPSLIISIHARRKISFEQIQLEWNNRLKGETAWKVENESFKTAPGVYRNFHIAYPRTARKSDRQFQEDGLNLTPRQLARIMGVPDDFKLYHEKGNLRYWLNKNRTLITKGMCYEVAEWFKKGLIKSKNKNLWKSQIV